MPARNVIEIVVRVVDQATAGLKAVTTQVNSLGTRISKALGGFSTLAKQALVFAGVGTAVYAAGAAFRKMFGAIEANETAIAQLEAGIRSTGGVAGYTTDQLQEMAARFQDITAYGDEAINQMQAVLLTFTKIRGVQFEEATLQIANLASRLKVDLQAAALQVGKALNDPVLGISMLSRAGIQFTATQKEVIKQLVETNQFVEAQKIILAELETQFGGSAEAARNTFSGALAAVQNRFSDLFEAGDGVVDPAIESLKELEETLNSPGVKQGFQVLLAGMLDLVGAAAKLGSFFGQIAAGIQVLFGATGDAVEKINNQVEEIDSTISKLESPFVRLFTGSETADARIAELKKLREELLATQSALIFGETESKPTPVEIAPVLQPDVQKEIDKAIKSSRTQFESQREAIQENIKVLQSFIDEYGNLEPAVRDAAGVTEEMLTNARTALGRLQTDLSEANADELARKLEITSISARRSLNDMLGATSEFSERTRTDAQRAADAWLDFRADLETALARGDFGQGRQAIEEYNKRLTEYLNDNLELAKVTARKVQVPMQELSTAGKRAVENLQDAFSDFFTNLDGGFKGLLRNVLQVFQKIVAEAAAARLVKAFNIEGIIKKAESPGRKAAQEYAEKVFAEISDESQATPGALAKAGGPKVGGAVSGSTERAREIVEQIKRDTADTTATVRETTDAVTQKGDELAAIVSENTRSAAATAQQQCACVCDCIRGLADVLREVAPQIASEVGGIKVEVPKAESVDLPRMPELPELPEIVVTAPPVEVPPVEVPPIEVPPINVPPIEVPPIEVPAAQVPPISIPEIEVPPVVLPDLPEFDTVDGGIKVYDVSSDKGVAGSVEASGSAVESEIRDSARSTTGAVGRVVREAAGSIGIDVRGAASGIIQAIFQAGSRGSGFFEDLAGNFLGGLLGGAFSGGGGSPADVTGAKGGLVPATAAMPIYRASGGLVPVRVGEEGPETVLLPGNSRVVNQRQSDFNAGDTTLNYQPVYNIRIEGAGDSRDTEQRLAGYLARRDAKLKSEVMGMLKDNGFGRMRA